ncbi:MAG: hypothetical protein MJZ74_00805 [Muribaculaceae bacterium]|nr:hypothetical protein [Muribaculaceae bacterium]
MDAFGHKYVDLGLPGGVLWATCNVGASKPEEYGIFFAWGETIGHAHNNPTFDRENYKWANGKYSWTKYEDRGNKTILDAEDDAATANWGKEWRMPTPQEYADLISDEYTTRDWVTVNGHDGWIITSKSNGNSIFLPAAGSHFGGLCNSEYSCFVGGCYWTDSLKNEDWACCLNFYSYSDKVEVSRISRVCGGSVRAVQVGSKEEEVARREAARKAAEEKAHEAARKKAEEAERKEAERRTAEEEAARKKAGPPCEYVDLGLPGGVLWATCNVGALSPWQNGLYFAWGEIVGYAKGENHTFDWEHYKWSINRYIKKYQTKSYNSDNKSVLDASDDVATVCWGAGWRMPSTQEIKDLLDSKYTTTEWVKVHGVKGRRITSKSNGNSIFLPAAGYRSYTSLNYEGSNGEYWSSSLDLYNDVNAFRLGFSSDRIGGGGDEWRYCGQSVRAVRVPTEEDARKKAGPPGKDDNGCEYVDLGLPGGVLWATCNIGASKPEEYGLYFAWGETVGYAMDESQLFDWAHYKWCNGKHDSLTKYCTSSSYGLVDNKKVLDAADDAATANWGNGWRMPTEQEIKDLYDSKYTSTKWVKVNGVKGRRITSKSNGNSIFLPAAGLRSTSYFLYEGSQGEYWSSDHGSSDYAHGLVFESGRVHCFGRSRCDGRSVRAVRVASK